jgi:hypothetical protein
MKPVSFFLMAATIFSALHAPLLGGPHKKGPSKRHKSKITQPAVVQTQPVIEEAQPILSTAVETQLPTPQQVIESALTELQSYAKLQQSLGIQNADLAYGMRKSLVMANLLINANGSLDTSLCPLVKSTFISSTNPEEYEVNMSKILDQLNASWETFFASMPASSNATGSLVLRGLFSLNPSIALTDRHVKVAVLAAMLSPYNQGPVGDCFAVNDVIRDHEEYYRHAAEDYLSVILNGSIARPVDGSTDYFFFLPDLADTDRNQTFSLSSTGIIGNTSTSFMSAPGFVTACTLMGGTNDNHLSDAVLKILSNTIGGSPLQVTPSQVIAAMAQVIASQTNANSHTLEVFGSYGFSSLTNNPVTRSVEAAFSAMAEDRPQDSTRGNVNACVSQSLQSTWDSLNAPSFQNAFNTAFNASYRLIYNLDIPLAQVSSDGSSSDGGFQLYKRDPTHPTHLGSRVATPQDFRELVLAAVDLAEQQLGTPGSSVGHTLRDVIKGDDFLRNALWAYDSSNQQESDPIQNYQKLSRTPMQSCDGDNPFEVDDIDTQVSYDNHVQVYTPNTAKDLITWCLTMAKQAQPEFMPMNSPQHAFNFAPNNPDMTSFIKKGKGIGQWLQSTLVVPGMKISRSPIKLATVQVLADTMYNQLSTLLQDNSSYQHLVNSLSQKSLSVKDFANQFLKGINHLLGSDENQAVQVALVFDAILLQALPANDLSILSHAAIRFAFTNWNQGTKNIYFCSFFNPRTEQISFGTIFEDKTNLQPMDENAWVNHQQWQVDLTPAAPVG